MSMEIVRALNATQRSVLERLKRDADEALALYHAAAAEFAPEVRQPGNTLRPGTWDVVRIVKEPPHA